MRSWLSGFWARIRTLEEVRARKRRQQEAALAELAELRERVAVLEGRADADHRRLALVLEAEGLDDAGEPPAELVHAAATARSSRRAVYLNVAGTQVAAILGPDGGDPYDMWRAISRHAASPPAALTPGGVTGLRRDVLPAGVAALAVAGAGAGAGYVVDRGQPQAVQRRALCDARQAAARQFPAVTPARHAAPQPAQRRGRALAVVLLAVALILPGAPRTAHRPGGVRAVSAHHHHRARRREGFVPPAVARRLAA